MEYLAPIIAAISTIITGWFAYNQRTKDKMTDLKIEKFKTEQQQKRKRNNRSSAIVFGQIWYILNKLGASRVYIVQPHPLGNVSMLSVYYEVDENGVDEFYPCVQNLRMSEVAKFSEEMANNLFMWITDIDAQIGDKYAKSLFMTSGCKSAAIKRLSDNRHDWVGSIFCEFNHKTDVAEEEIRKVMHEVAIKIQYILPEIEE